MVPDVKIRRYPSNARASVTTTRVEVATIGGRFAGIDKAITLWRRGIDEALAHSGPRRIIVS